MSSIGGVSNTGASDLMKVLEQNQAQALELTKKMIKIATAGKVSQVTQDGLGENIDVQG